VTQYNDKYPKIRYYGDIKQALRLKENELLVKGGLTDEDIICLDKLIKEECKKINLVNSIKKENTNINSDNKNEILYENVQESKYMTFG
jgi:hypothetical protein